MVWTVETTVQGEGHCRATLVRQRPCSPLYWSPPKSTLDVVGDVVNDTFRQRSELLESTLCKINVVGSTAWEKKDDG